MMLRMLPQPHPGVFPRPGRGPGSSPRRPPPSFPYPLPRPPRIGSAAPAAPGRNKPSFIIPCCVRSAILFRWPILCGLWTAGAFFPVSSKEKPERLLPFRFLSGHKWVLTSAPWPLPVRAGKLVGAGGPSAAAVDALQTGNGLLCLHALHQRGNALEVAVAACPPPGDHGSRPDRPPLLSWPGSRRPGGWNVYVILCFLLSLFVWKTG